ncbi:hypothetical protein QTO30_12960 [Yoonia sp. GPGPB17]|uniref:hypothetical protein n=1 Tax=Yoonia sp. GPGPB17 TaxID=3026147 RepID=UPI0030BD3F43
MGAIPEWLQTVSADRLNKYAESILDCAQCVLTGIHKQTPALGVASIILPLRLAAGAAASADVLSGGHLLLGVASVDRPFYVDLVAVDDAAVRPIHLGLRLPQKWSEMT